MRISFLLWFLFLLVVAAGTAHSQVFEVIALDGSAKVQRVQKKEWEKMSIGSQLHDNDITESFFQTKCVLRFGKGNVVIIGSNSKVLLNIRERENSPGVVVSDVNLTLFSGACFVKAIAQAHIAVYTSNAVGETDSGSFSTVVESRTGETGFQVLGGKVKTRNIAQKEGIECNSGQTTMIFPGKEPTAPLYITYKHVSVLKHFFGEEYVQSEMDAAGIKPTEDRTSRSSTLLSDAMMEGRVRGDQDLSSYKIPFSLNKIYGAIISDREKRKRLFTPLKGSHAGINKGFYLEQRTSIALANGGVYPIVSLVPSYTSGGFDAGLRLPLASNYTGSMSMYGFSSFAGILDKIDHLSWESAGGRISVGLGAQNDLTIGSGNVVSGFSNADPYSVLQPLGLSISFSTSDLGMQVFMADVSRFSMGGVHVAYAPATYHFGAGYFFDADQFHPISPKESNRFKILPDTISDTVAAAAFNAHIYEMDFAWDLLLSEDFQASFHADFAQKLKSGSTDGFVLKVPQIAVSWNRMQLLAGLVTESGRLVDGEFNAAYMANRWKMSGASGAKTLVTQNTILSEKRLCQGVDLSFAINPYKGTSIEFFLRQNLHETHTFSIDTMKLGPGTDLSLSLCINDGLFKPVRFGEVYLRQDHSGLYPPHSALFSSWEFAAGASVATHPLYVGISLDANVCMRFLDLNFDNKVGPGDGLFSFSIGFVRGFN
jgi:hypothetical protein